MAEQDTIRDLVSKAWNYQREGKPDTAAAEFEKIVQKYPQDIDANYGLGLALKSAGQIDRAVKSFKTTLELVAESKKTYDATKDQSSDQDTIKTPEDDRFMMLSRMVNQRLAELQGTTQDS